jgi:phosphinothricin acetyltransferase
MEIKTRKLEEGDFNALIEIYRYGIETGNATFDKNPPGWEEWNYGHLRTCRIAAEANSVLIGWAALSPISKKDAYRGAAEVSIYIAKDFTGRGIGKKLLDELIRQSEADGIWTLEAKIFPENTASIKLHTSCGFREVGYRERIGMLNGVWRNTVLMERRSKII